MIPLSTFHKFYPDTKELAIAFTVPKGASIDQAKDEVTEAMRRRRHVPFNAETISRSSRPTSSAHCGISSPGRS